MRAARPGAMLRPMVVRLLIVDDNERFLAASRAILQRQGLEVIAVARSTAEGLLRAQLLRPDLVLVDIGLGEDSGFELVRQLASDDDTADLNVILISTQSEDDFAELIRESPPRPLWRRPWLARRRGHPTTSTSPIASGRSRARAGS
jgi:two-component system nitrate/nitrite response regulator NarL